MLLTAPLLSMSFSLTEYWQLRSKALLIKFFNGGWVGIMALHSQHFHVGSSQGVGNLWYLYLVQSYVHGGHENDLCNTLSERENNHHNVSSNRESLPHRLGVEIPWMKCQNRPIVIHLRHNSLTWSLEYAKLVVSYLVTAQYSKGFIFLFHYGLRLTLSSTTLSLHSSNAI